MAKYRIKKETKRNGKTVYSIQRWAGWYEGWQTKIIKREKGIHDWDTPDLKVAENRIRELRGWEESEEGQEVIKTEYITTKQK